MRRRGLIVCAAAGLSSRIAVARAGIVRPPLTVWFTVEGAKAMRRVGERFTAATGVPLLVETPDPSDGPSKFQQGAVNGKGPDIFIYAHDRIGEWIAGGVIHAVTPSRRFFEDIEPLAWQGFSARGRLWGYPYAVEAITLIHNRTLVPTPPATFEEVIALDRELQRQGRRAILWDYTNPYFTWPLIAAHGGYAFRPLPDGGWDLRDTGVATPGAMPGLLLLERLLRTGLMPTGSGYAEMEAAMAQGKVAMMINGPWAWTNLKRVGIDFGIAPIPAVAGKPSAPFVGIKGALVSRATKQREVAAEFLEHHFLTPEGLRELDTSEPIGAPASRRYFAQLAGDARIAGIMASAKQGVPTPSVAQMGRFWSTMKSALTNLSEGRQEAAAAMAGAKQRILAP